MDIPSDPFRGMTINLDDGREVVLVEDHNSGRSADVWEGSLENHRVAVKIYRPVFESSPLFIDNINRESELKCDDERVVTPIGRGDLLLQDDRWSRVIVFPIVDGEQLSALLESGGIEKPEDKLRLCRELVLALRSLHACGYIHGDLCPNNVIASAEYSKASLVDMEFCLPINRERENSDWGSEEGWRGTLGYIAPEVEEFGIMASGLHSDVWGLGWTLAEILNLPEVPTLRERDWVSARRDGGASISMLGSWISGFGPKVDEVIRRCLIINAELRPSTIEVVEMLGDYLE